MTAGPIERARELLASGTLNEAEARLLREGLLRVQVQLQQGRWQPYPWQVAPAHVETMGAWLLFGGRGTGKTEAGARYVDGHVNGLPCDPRIKGGHRVAIIAPTHGDAQESCVSGPSGLLTINPQLRYRGGEVPGVIWPSGARARIFGAHSTEDVQRLRAGGNNCLVWGEEVAAFRYLDAALTQSRLGLRIGDNPHYVMSTTPRPRKEIKALLADPHTVVTKGSTRDAIHLDPAVRDSLFALYEGTRMGRQELDAELLEDIEGALWSYALIDDTRVSAHPRLERICVAVDPGGTSKVAGRETGIVVVGVVGDHAYVIADLSGSYTPDEWATAAVAAYDRYGANAIVVEKNYGGEMTVNTLRTVDRPDGAAYVNIVPITARQGKSVRAEPVVAIYEQRRAHHVGVLSALETQLTEWVPGDDSPDRLDALVHAVTYLLVKSGPSTVSNPAAMGQRVIGGSYGR